MKVTSCPSHLSKPDPAGAPFSLSALLLSVPSFLHFHFPTFLNPKLQHWSIIILHLPFFLFFQTWHRLSLSSFFFPLSLPSFLAHFLPFCSSPPLTRVSSILNSLSRFCLSYSNILISIPFHISPLSFFYYCSSAPSSFLCTVKVKNKSILSYSTSHFLHLSLSYLSLPFSPLSSYSIYTSLWQIISPASSLNIYVFYIHLDSFLLFGLPCLYSLNSSPFLLLSVPFFFFLSFLNPSFHLAFFPPLSPPSGHSTSLPVHHFPLLPFTLRTFLLFSFPPFPFAPYYLSNLQFIIIFYCFRNLIHFHALYMLPVVFVYQGVCLCTLQCQLR